MQKFDNIKAYVYILKPFKLKVNKNKVITSY